MHSDVNAGDPARGIVVCRYACSLRKLWWELLKRTEDAAEIVLTIHEVYYQIIRCRYTLQLQEVRK